MIVGIPIAIACSGMSPNPSPRVAAIQQSASLKNLTVSSCVNHFRCMNTLSGKVSGGTPCASGFGFRWSSASKSARLNASSTMSKPLRSHCDPPAWNLNRLFSARGVAFQTL